MPSRPHSSDNALPARWPFPGSLNCAPLPILWMHHFMDADKHIRCFAKADSRDRGGGGSSKPQRGVLTSKLSSPYPRTCQWYQVTIGGRRNVPTVPTAIQGRVRLGVAWLHGLWKVFSSPLVRYQHSFLFLYLPGFHLFPFLHQLEFFSVNLLHHAPNNQGCSRSTWPCA
jgi:hypothetical protein